MELYARVRHACQSGGLSECRVARRFGIHRNTVRKMLAFSVPPGYRRSKPPARPELDPFTPLIDEILETALGTSEAASPGQAGLQAPA